MHQGPCGTSSTYIHCIDHNDRERLIANQNNSRPSRAGQQVTARRRVRDSCARAHTQRQQNSACYARLGAKVWSWKNKSPPDKDERCIYEKETEARCKRDRNRCGACVFILTFLADLQWLETDRYDTRPQPDSAAESFLPRVTQSDRHFVRKAPSRSLLTLHFSIVAKGSSSTGANRGRRACEFMALSVDAAAVNCRLGHVGGTMERACV